MITIVAMSLSGCIGLQMPEKYAKSKVREDAPIGYDEDADPTSDWYDMNKE